MRKLVLRIQSLYRWYVSATPFPRPEDVQFCLEFLKVQINKTVWQNHVFQPLLKGRDSIHKKYDVHGYGYRGPTNAYHSSFWVPMCQFLRNKMCWRTTKAEASTEIVIPQSTRHLLMLPSTDYDKIMDFHHFEPISKIVIGSVGNNKSSDMYASLFSSFAKCFQYQEMYSSFSYMDLCHAIFFLRKLHQADFAKDVTTTQVVLFPCKRLEPVQTSVQATIEKHSHSSSSCFYNHCSKFPGIRLRQSSLVLRWNTPFDNGAFWDIQNICGRDYHGRYSNSSFISLPLNERERAIFFRPSVHELLKLESEWGAFFNSATKSREFSVLQKHYDQIANIPTQQFNNNNNTFASATTIARYCIDQIRTGKATKMLLYASSAPTLKNVQFYIDRLQEDQDQTQALVVQVEHVVDQNAQMTDIATSMISNSMISNSSSGLSVDQEQHKEQQPSSSASSTKPPPSPYQCVMLGRTTVSKSKALRCFRDDANCRFLMVNENAASSGMDCVNANQVVNCDMDVRMTYEQQIALDKQLGGRVNRISQRHPTIIVRFLPETSTQSRSWVTRLDDKGTKSYNVEEIKEDTGMPQHDSSVQPATTQDTARTPSSTAGIIPLDADT